MDASYNKYFTYTHDNPYHERLAEFSKFVLRDLESEEYQNRWNKEVFINKNPLVVEIGSGYGEFMREYCQNNPIENFIGMDYRFKRSFQLAEKLEKADINNFRYLRAKGERIGHIFGEGEVDKIYYFFPDPWPKTRHNKKRLINEHFLKIVHSILNKNGAMYIKTDHDGYAAWMKKFILNSTLFEIIFESWDLKKEYPDHFLSSYETRFEKIFIKQNIPIKAFIIKPL